MSEDVDLLGPTPTVDVEVVEDHTLGEGGFLRLRRLTLQNRWPDGHRSAPYRYDLVERDATDAVGIVLWARGDEPRVCLRSALRPPLAFRAEYALPLDEVGGPVLWEIPAGLVEPSERGEEGLRSCAARETLEEVGLTLAPGDFTRLGPGVTLSPGVLAEKLHFFVAEVDPSTRGTPTEDGTPVEERAEVRFVTLDHALAACRDGRVADLKTETAIRRLQDHLREGSQP